MKIKKCPYCSGVANFGEYDDYDRFYYYLYCTSCGAHTKLFPKKYDALMVWNYREADELKRYNKEVEHLPPYVWMANEATRNLSVYGTTIVAMRINGIRFNEILEYDAVDDCWSWVSDWYEGQTDIEFIGAIPLDEVQVNEAIST